MDNVEMAQDSFEKAHEHAGHAHEAAPTSTRVAAVLVAILAAMAVVMEMSGNDQQTAYLAHDVAASDLWSQYQGKSVRHTVMLESADILETQSAAVPADVAARLLAKSSAARDAAARLADEPGHDGMSQLAARAQQEQHGREHALHLHEGYERSVRGLQIAIVLVGLFMATRLFWLLGVGATLGLVALTYGILTSIGLS